MSALKEGTPGQVHPNVVIVLADQLRGTALGCAGNADVATPNADRLAAEGTRFPNAVANSPVCGPSRASLLTGRYPLAHRVLANDLPLPEGIGTLGDLFGSAGYRTGYIGKWHLDGVPRDKWTPPGPRRHGFKFWAAYNCSHDYFRQDKYYSDSATPVRVDGYEPEVQTDLAVRFIEESTTPFLLFLSWGPPHNPYEQVPQAYRDRYDPERVRLRPNVSVPNDGLPDGERQVRRATADYYAAVTALDDQLARVVRALEGAGLTRDTIVVYMSDHGDMLWSHGRTQKQGPWEESIGIPFIVRWPGRIPAGAVRQELLSVTDIAPTIAGLCGLPHGPATEGQDLSAAVRGETGAGAHDVALLMNVMAGETPYREGIREWRGVRTQRFTYARHLGGEPWLLYDNQTDPYQLRNLAREPHCKDTVQHLDQVLSTLLTATGDAFLPGVEQIRRFDLTEPWNARERELNPECPRLL